MNVDPGRLHGSSYDVVIVGAGIMGSATAYQLTKKAPELKILLLEQYGFGHRRGSSHGSSRIIRKSYHESYYCKMMRKSFDLWHQAEREANTRVISMTGGIDFVKKGTMIEKKLKRAMEEAEVAFQELDKEELVSRFPGFSMPDHFTSFYSEDAGVVNASKACALFQNLARTHGAELAEEVKLESVLEDNAREGEKSVTICTSAGEIKCRKLIFTAGPWNQKLLNHCFGLDLKMKSLNTTVVYWRCKDPSSRVYAAPGCPIFIAYSDDDRCLNAYGTPAIEYPGLVKFCLHSGYEQDPDNRLCIPNVEDIDRKLKEMTRTFLPHVDSSNHVMAEACMYTNTLDDNFVLDFLPGRTSKNIIVGAGFSGHGFKFGPLIGDILSDLALGSKLEFSLEPFRIGRLIHQGSA